jgi:hypothetical protein
VRDLVAHATGSATKIAARLRAADNTCDQPLLPLRCLHCAGPQFPGADRRGAGDQGAQR